MSSRHVRSLLLALALAQPIWAQSPTLKIVSFQPAESSYLGKTPFEISGDGFNADTRVTIDDVTLTPTLVDARTLTGLLPPHAASTKPLAVAVENRSRATAQLPGAVSFIGPLEIVSVTPATVPASESVPVTLSGVGFTPQSTITVNNAALLEKVFIDARTIRGRAPSLPAGKYNVKVSEAGIFGPPTTFTLEGGMTYEGRSRAELPPPQEIETSLAEGTARFAWRNPVSYANIRVLDTNGKLIQLLPGDASFLELPVGSIVNRKDIQLQGTTTAASTDKIDAVAMAYNCDRPPPLGGAATPGDVQFHLFGGHLPADVEPCGDGQGGGAAALARSTASQGGGGNAQEPGSIGWSIPAIDFSAIPLVGRNQVTTGFTLEKDADVLELKAYYEKLNHDFGLELRAHLIHVFPNDGFEDEVAFPDIFAGDQRDWHNVNYYRTHFDAASGERKPCVENGQLKMIPKGEYLLELYAVGGDPHLAYFVIYDDSRDKELLIPGVPCPPYPMVQVTDLTGFATLPEICDMKPFVIYPPGDLFEKLTVSVAAVGTWRDADNSVYRIHPRCFNCELTDRTEESPCTQDPYKVYPGVEYIWTIYDKAVPTTKSSGSVAETTFELPDYGCYKILLEIRDRACGFSQKRFREIAFIPESSTCPNQYFSFDYPTPEPGGFYAVAGLSPPPGHGKMENERPIEFRVLVMPKCYCTGESPCTAAFLDLEPGEKPEDHLSDAGDDVQFRFAVPGPFGTATDLHAPVKVIDLCPAITGGPKFFLVRVDDLGQVPASAALKDFSFSKVVIQARTNFERVLSGGQTVRQPRNDPWHSVGKPFRMTNRPSSLANSYWSGVFDERDSSYHFVVKSSPNTEENHDLGPSAAIPLEIPGVDAGVPSYDENHIASGFTSRFQMQGGIWSPETGDGTYSGNTMGNKIEGKPIRPEPSVSFGSALRGDGGGGIIDPGAFIPSYEWCHHETIFKRNFSQEIFEAVIYTGFIGPVPVTIKGSVSLGLAFAVESLISTRVSPWEAFDGGKFVDAKAYAISKVAVSVPASITADILGGIASIAMRLIPEATFELDPYVTVVNASAPQADYFLQALFNLYFEVEACIQTVVMGEQCFSPGRIALIKNKAIFPGHGDPPDTEACDGQSLAAPGAGEPAGDGGGVIEQNNTFIANMPVNVTSPDGKSTLFSYVKEDGGEVLHTQVNDQVVQSALLPGTSFYLFNPAAAFMSNDAALMAWTEPDAAIDLVAVVDDQDDPAYLATRNSNTRRSNIGVAPIVQQNGEWKMLSPIPISDEIGDAATGRRADGMASVSGDIAEGDALVAWVRYESPEYLVRDGVKVVPVPCPDGQICPLLPGKRFYNVVAPNFRPQMEQTAIYARRAGIGGPIGGKLKISGAGINIEPSVSVSPAGDLACCVWVNDPTHTDLIGSNLGRFLKYSVHSKGTDSWSAPANAIATPDDFPALLEPRVLLKADGTGLVAFTALDPGAPVSDTGLGGARFLFGMRILDLAAGQFGAPFKIHGKCDSREYAFGQSLATDVPILDLPPGPRVPLPEWVMVYQGSGPAGTRLGSGNVMVTVLGQGASEWTQPMRLTNDENIHSNIVASVGAGKIHVVHLNGGPATRPVGTGAGGGFSGSTYETFQTDLLPDLAVTSCTLSHQFSAPGAKVEAAVEIENLGLAGTAIDGAGKSLVGVQAVFIAADGRTRIVGSEPLPQTAPGGRQMVTFALEMPHEPVELLVEINPNPVDRDPSNDSRRCFFGAPAPRDLTCAAIYLNHEADEEASELPLGVQLRWTNVAVLDEVFVYRDGGMLASLPGRSTAFVDTETSSGEHLYSVRGRIGPSKSVRIECRVAVTPPAGPAFRRSDSDMSSKVDISDAIRTLAYLFLGGTSLPCQDAADADDNGAIEITDAIRTLGFLFLGDAFPPAPGPAFCGTDPTPDALPPCGGECR